jgi:murein DD-endopeptidase MepM/ murein hydrolase activator NlpD
LTGNVIRPGQTLVVPGSEHQGIRQPAAAPRYSAPVESRYRQPSSAPPSYRAPAPSAPQVAGQIYTVRPGDSLYRISRRTGVSVTELKRTNGITDVRALKPGMRLSLGGAAVPNETAPRQPLTRQPNGQYAARSQTRVASRTEQRSPIQPKTIRTVPMVRTTSPPVTQPPEAPDTVRQPRILNQRPSTPIATKPETKSASAPAAAPDDKFRWPARGRIIAEFNHSGKGVKNDGVNIALPVGTEVGAAGDGVVAYAGNELKGYGNLVLVRHDNGWVSAYAHASEVLVKRGDRVTRGQTIAKAGRSGGVTQPQLHFELRQGAKPVDPIPYMDQM